MLKNSLFALLLLSLTAAAQSNEQSLQRLGNAYLMPSNASSADSLAEVFADSLWSFISINKNYGKTLPSVRNLSVQLPADQSFALYTWIVPQPNGGFTYHGFYGIPIGKDLNASF